MPSSEKFGNRPPYPVGATFAKLLEWHLDFGTRPDASPARPGARWDNIEFSKAVDVERTGRTVRNWRGGRNRPDGIGSIEFVLFGQNAAFNEWRFDLRAAFEGRSAESDIPLPPGDFLGRDVDLDAIRTALLGNTHTRAILVQGPPGIGKTALTKAVAHDPAVVKHFAAHPRWFVRLETTTTATLLQDAITRVVGADPQAGFQATLTLLGQRPCLLVLDNLESPWELPEERRATEETLAVIAKVPGLALLASFRGRERVAGPAWTLIHSVERLAAPSDADLFSKVAGRSYSGDPHLERFLAALGGVPLAIELVAHHAYGMDALAVLWAKWKKIRTKLARHPDYAPGRDTSLPHSIELSLRSKRMTKASHRLFRLLGQLPAGLAAEDRDQLIGVRGFAADEELRRVGLAVMRDERLDLLSPIREHAMLYCPPSGKDKSAWPMHYLDMTRRLGKTIGTRAGFRITLRLLPELTNINAAFQAVMLDRLDQATAALEGYGSLVQAGSIPAPIFVELGKAYRSSGNVRGEAECIYRYGRNTLRRSNQEDAKRAFEQSMSLYHSINDVNGEAECIREVGEIALERSDYDDARRKFDTSMHMFISQCNRIGESICLSSIGEIFLRSCQFDKAYYYFINSMNIAKEVDYTLGEVGNMLRIGKVYLRKLDYCKARYEFENSLILYRKLGFLLGEANCIRNLGHVEMENEEYDSALEKYKMALPLYEEINDVLGRANCIRFIGSISFYRGDNEEALRGFGDAINLYRQVGDVLGEAECIFGEGEVCLARGNYEDADIAFKQALTLYRRVSDIEREANCLKTMGKVALEHSNKTKGRQLLSRAKVLYQSIGNKPGEETCRKLSSKSKIGTASKTVRNNPSDGV